MSSIFSKLGPLTAVSPVIEVRRGCSPGLFELVILVTGLRETNLIVKDS
jgi:hypothetical protein